MPPKLRALSSPTVRVGVFSTHPARARPARGVNDDQYHILGHLSTSFAAGMMSQYVIYRRYFLGRGERLFVFSSFRLGALRLFRASRFLLSAPSGDQTFARLGLFRGATSQNTPGDGRLGTAELSESINLYRSLEPLRHAYASALRRRASTSSGLA